MRYCLHSVLLAALLIAGCNAQIPDESGRQSAAPGEGGTARAAAFVDQTVPAEMAPGQSYTVSVKMRNTGTATWTAAESYRIGSRNPIDNDFWGFRRVAVPVPVAPGEEATFTFTLKSPPTPGDYNFQWRMVRDGVEWFGDETPNVLITVGGPPAKDAK